MELSKDQEVFLNYFRRFLSRKTDDHEDVMLLLGAPGTGKSIAAVKACEVGEKCGNVLRTSWNGIAAAIVNGGTIATTFAVTSNQKRNSPVEDLKEAELLQLQQRIGNLDISLLIIDEVSTLSPRVFVTIDARLRQLMCNADTPFGGVSILLVGDFMQIPPFGKMTLCKCSLMVAWYEKTKRVPHGYDRADFVANGIMHRAAELFNKCKLVQINKQLRCKDTDIKHQDLIMKMWNGQQLKKEDLKQYRFLSKQDSREDHAWEFATILVTGNKVRQSMNAAQAKRFASRHKTHLVKWPLKVQYLKGDKNVSGHNHTDDPALWGYFVHKGPAYLTSNINPTLNLANGTKVQQYSLYFEDRAMRYEFDHLLQTTPLSETITLSEMPTAVIVKITISPDQTWTYCNLASNKKDILVPVVQNLRFPTVMDTWIKADGKNVFPAKVRTTDPLGIQLSFALTYDKAQGQTIDKLILCLEKNPVGKLQMTYNKLLVGLTRVQHSQDMRILPSQGGNDSVLNYLLDLMPEPEYFHWLKGFEKSVWSSWNKDLSLQSMGNDWEGKKQVISKRRQYSKINGEAIRKRQRMQQSMSKHKQTLHRPSTQVEEQKHTDEGKISAPRLRNFRNDCYINSVMQSLHNLKATHDLVQKTTSHVERMKLNEEYNVIGSDEEKNETYGSIQRSRTKLYNEFLRCITDMNNSSSSILDMRTLKLMFNQLLKMEDDNAFDNEEQQDAEEFFSKLCQGLHDFITVTQIENNNLIADMFTTKMCKLLRCLECGHQNRTAEEPNWSLILKCEQLQHISAIPLETVLNHYLKTVELHENDRWHCPLCRRKTRSTTTDVISSTGNVLVVVLSRCFHDNNGPTKSTAMIHCPSILQVSTENEAISSFQVSYHQRRKCIKMN